MKRLVIDRSDTVGINLDEYGNAIPKAEVWLELIDDDFTSVGFVQYFLDNGYDNFVFNAPYKTAKYRTITASKSKNIRVVIGYWKPIDHSNFVK